MRRFMLRLAAAVLFVLPGAGAGQEIRLVIRGDDLGMTQGSLVAFERAFNQGVLTSGAMVVPGPWFEAAAEMARKNPGWCVGVHLCLVGEWRGYRWRSVSPREKVRSMVDEDGYLYTSPAELFSHKPRIEEMEAELRAQVELAKKRGVNVQYLDLHYISPSQYPGFGEMVNRIAKDYNLPVSQSFGEKGISVYATPVEQKLDRAVEMLEKLEPGLYLWVCHIGIDSPEQGALIHYEPAAIFVRGGVGKHRAEELRVLTSLDVKSAILKKGIVLTNYRELWEKKR